MSNFKFIFLIVGIMFAAAFLARKAFGITGNPLDTAISNKTSINKYEPSGGSYADTNW